MSVAEKLAAAAKASPPPDQQVPPLGAAPQSDEEVAAAQQAIALERQELQMNKLRFDQLSGAIFARLFAESGILEQALSAEGTTVNQDVLNQTIQLCNILSSHAAMGHATGVWQLQLNKNQSPPAGQPAQPPPAK